MKRLLLLLLLPCSLALAAWPNGYTFRRTVTIDHTKVGASDSSNFPVALFGAYSYLATVANGGNVQSSSGFDIIFTSDANGSTKIAFDRANWNALTGAVEFHFLASTLSHTADTILYEFYGNASVTTDQATPATLWSTAGYQGVWHGGDGTTLSLVDSTGNSSGPTNLSGLVIAGPGEVGGGMFCSPGGCGIDTNTEVPSLFDGVNTKLTVSYWVNNPNAASGVSAQQVWGSLFTSSSLLRIENGDEGGGNGQQILVLLADSDSYSNYSFAGQTQISDIQTSLHHVLISLDLSTLSNSQAYFDGSAMSNQRIGSGGAYGGVLRTLGSNFTLFRFGSSVLSTATLDEVRLSNQFRGADWDTAEFNNQSSPTTFYAIGSAQTLANAKGHIIIGN